MPVEPSPGPWKIQDYEKRGYQIVASDGAQVALMHYPKGAVEAANCRLVEMAPELLKRFRTQLSLLEALIRNARIDPGKEPNVVAGRVLLAEIEIRSPVKGDS